MPRVSFVKFTTYIILDDKEDGDEDLYIKILLTHNYIPGEEGWISWLVRSVSLKGRVESIVSFYLTIEVFFLYIYFKY